MARTERIGETGGGGIRGGGAGAGRGMGRVAVRPGNGTKPAPRPKVELKPEPSSVKIKPGKTSLGPESANKANAKIQAERNRTSSTKNEKSALKAANKPAKYKSAEAARQKSIDRANKAIANAKMTPNGPKITEAQKIAYKRGLTVFDKLGKKK